MWLFAFVTLGAVVGAWARYGMTLLIQNTAGTAFPWATLCVNVLGCFLMGFLFFEMVERVTISPELRTGLLTGTLGSFTTFSTFSMEALLLLEDGQPVKAALYITASLLLGVAAAAAGAYVSRSL